MPVGQQSSPQTVVDGGQILFLEVNPMPTLRYGINFLDGIETLATGPLGASLDLFKTITKKSGRTQGRFGDKAGV